MSEISQQLREHGIQLRRYEPGDHKTLCPKCSHTRRNKKNLCLSVTIEAGNGAVWNCHNCPWTGNVSGRENRSEPRRQRNRPPPAKPAYAPPEDALSPNLVKWFARRGISEAVIRRNKIDLKTVWMPGPDAEVPVVAFPYYRDGEVVNVKYRDKDKNFRQEKGAEKILYGLDDIRDATEIIIVEGECDKLALEEAGITNVVSVPDGAPEQVREGPIDPESDAKFDYLRNCADVIEKIEKFIIATDADSPGLALAEELARRIGKERCWRVIWPAINDAPRKDANEVLVEDGKDVLRECIANAEPWPIEGLHSADDYRDDVLRLYRDGHEQIFSLGWPCVDEVVKARPGDLVVLTGIPNHGKSEWLDACMVNLAETYGWRFAICSFENEPPEHCAKLAEKRARMRFFDGPTTRMGEGDLAGAMGWINDHFHFIRDERESQTIDWILANAKSAVLRHGVRCVVVDPWGEVEHHRPDNMTETEYIGLSLGKMRRFAQLHGVWFVVVAHPTKLMRDGKKYQPPSLYDISGSAHWHNKPDLGIVVYRLFDTSPPQTEIYIRKVRRKWVGQIGVTMLDYDVTTGCYADSNERKSRDAYASMERQGHG